MQVDENGYSRPAGVENAHLVNRKDLREKWNQQELYMEELFTTYDKDGSGYLEINELKQLLSDHRNGMEPSEDEVDWILQISSKRGHRKIRKEELFAAMRSWEGYRSLPDDLMKMFNEFDVNGDGFLEITEFQNFLTRYAGHSVSKIEAEEVLQTADLLSDGKLGRYELLGAVGAWYISLGREPSAHMAIAFAANNRTVSRFHKILHVLIAATLVPTAYFPFAGAIYSMDTACQYHLSFLLWADGILWLVLTVVILLKVHWVQCLNSCRSKGKEISGSLLVRWAWFLISTEVLTVMALVGVESYGAYWALIESSSLGEDERRACNQVVNTPWDCYESMKSLSFKRYSSFVEFCEKWFTFNLIFNFVCLLFYYICIAYRFFVLYKHDRALCVNNEGSLKSALNDDKILPPPERSSLWEFLLCCRRTPRTFEALTPMERERSS